MDANNPSPSNSPSATEMPATESARPSRLWLWVVAAFALQAAVWTAWLVIASHHKVATVPLAGTAVSDPR